MFCTNCGNEIQDGAKFCVKCGKSIENVEMPDKKPAQNEPMADKKDGKRIILIVAIIVCAILIVLLAINKIAGNRQSTDNQPNDFEQSVNDEDGKNTQNIKGGYDSYEDVIDAYYRAAFDKDVKGVVACYPEKMQSMMQNLYNKYRGGDYFGDQAVFRFTTEADGNEYSYMLGELLNLSTDEQSEIESKYGISFDEAYTVETSLSCKYVQEMMGSSGYVTETTSAPLKVAKIGEKWFLIEGTAEWMWQQQ